MGQLLLFATLLGAAVASPFVTPAPFLDEYTTVCAESEPVPVLPVALPESGDIISPAPVLVPAPVMPEPVELPVILEQNESPIIPEEITPALPLPERPVSIAPIAPEAEESEKVSIRSSPLVQIILNINQVAAEVSPAPVAVAPVAVAPAEVQPTPVSVVEAAEEVIPVIVVENAPEAVQVVEPVIVVETAPVVVDPMQVIEAAPIAVEPILIGTPIIPSPAVALPEELN